MYCPYCNIGIDDRQMRSRHCNNCGHDWEVIHVTPVGDKKPHSDSYTCSCEPELQTEGFNMVCIHNSFDGREGVEWANDLLNH